MQNGLPTPDNREPSTGGAVSNLTNGIPKLSDGGSDAAACFDALVKDRDALRLEVTQLRQSLEELQSKHTTEMEAEKESVEEQCQSLLGKVNTIRSQLGEQLKADAVGYQVYPRGLAFDRRTRKI